MEPSNHGTPQGRSGRSIFDMAEIRSGSGLGTGRAAARGGSAERAPEAPQDRPLERPIERSTERQPDPRTKSVSLTDRQLALTIGAIEHVIGEMRRLPGTEATLKEFESCLYPLRQALAILPPAPSK
ncbi:MAG TPA: hypothetical protein V6D00_08720 [Pantanalinema sp.]